MLGGGATYVRMPRLENGKRICFYWNFTEGCANGDKCYFAHVPVRICSMFTCFE